MQNLSIKMFHSPNEERSASQPDLSKEMDTPNYVATRKRKQRFESQEMTLIRSEIQDMLASVKEDRESQNSKFYQAFEELRAQNVQIIKTNAKIEKILDHTTTLYEKLQEKVDKISIEHNEALIKIDQLENQIEEMQRVQRSTTLEIRNIPEKKDENLSDLLSKVHRALNVPFNPDHVKSVRRIKSGQNKLIIAEYQSVQQTRSLIKALKDYNNSKEGSKFNIQCVNAEGDKQPIYISEFLTPAARKLLYFARDLRKNHGYKYCWTGLGRVFVKKADTTSTIWVKSIQQVEALKQHEINQ